ncbi:hypothetical protein HDU83_000236 [Entophlyctis luteolus]|nr:hypothetical protein HDU83_000236 [Entophlyctis luteolus]
MASDRRQSMLAKQASAAPKDERRISMLDITREKLIKIGKVSFPVVVVGKIQDCEKKTEIAAYYQKLFKLHQTDTELITGMMFMLQDTYFHILEGSEKVILAFLRDLCGKRLPVFVWGAGTNMGTFESRENHYFSDSKVLLLASDVMDRTFSFWASKIVDFGSNAAPYYVDETSFSEENIEKTIADLCVAVCRIGKTLGELSKAELKESMDGMATKFPDVLPRNELIKFICNECNGLLRIEEWADIYDSHMEPTQQSEHVWPAPKMIDV